MFKFLKQFFHKTDETARSPKWRNVRSEHLKLDPICRACGSDEDLEVHHIEPVQICPEKELDPNNLITLCGKHCHFVFGHLMDYKSWNTNVVEDAATYYSKLKQRPRK